MRSKTAGPAAFAAILSIATLAGVATRSAPGTEPTKSKPDLPLAISQGQSLAQTGPNGTMMGFACQYQFRAGSRSAKSKYVLIVKNASKKSAEIPFQSEEKGEFDAFVDGWRPADAPFEGHFEEIVDKANRRAVSASIDFTLEPSQQP
jgi:hypothetical protein